VPENVRPSHLIATRHCSRLCMTRCFSPPCTYLHRVLKVHWDQRVHLGGKEHQENRSVRTTLYLGVCLPGTFSTVTGTPRRAWSGRYEGRDRRPWAHWTRGESDQTYMHKSLAALLANFCVEYVCPVCLSLSIRNVN
jgi:hypothetical protein